MLPRTRRLTQDREIRAVVRVGTTIRARYLTLKSRAHHGTGRRFAVVMSKKAAKKATDRNTVKRRIRALLTTTQGQFPDNTDYVFFVQPVGGTLPSSQLLRTDLDWCLTKIRR